MDFMSRQHRGLRTGVEDMRGDTRIAARPSLELHIDELVLHGFSTGDRRRIGEAVEHELVRLLSGRAGLQPWLESREVARVDGGVFEVASNARPEMIGVRVAQMVYGQLAQAPPSVRKKSTAHERDHPKWVDGEFR
jgi:hypothetical protein